MSNIRTFESLRDFVYMTVLEQVTETETYVVCDIYARFSIYLINPPEGLVEQISEVLGIYAERVESIPLGGFIHKDLRTPHYINPLIIERNIYYVDRHAQLANWDLRDRYESSIPIVGFYSFKGGLGRTTALALTAIHLARKGQRVVLMDFDLEAPGLASIFASDELGINQTRGIVDYLTDLSSLKFPLEDLPLIDYYHSISRQEIVGTQGGELFIFPAGKTQAEENLYFSKFSKLNPSFKSGNSTQAIDRLLRHIERELRPDQILVDTRTGLNDLGGLVMTRYASQAFLFFFGSQQNMFGLETLLPKLKEYREVLQFSLVNSPVPKSPLAEPQRQYYLERSYDLFSDLFYEENYIPSITDATALHYPIEVPYNDLAVLLDNKEKLKALAEHQNGENPYAAMANLIAGRLSDSTSELSLESHTSTENLTIVEALSDLVPVSASAEYEFDSLAKLTCNFYPRKDYRFIFDKTKYLILGEKGAGKTALYAVLDQPEYARALAEYCEMNDSEMRATTWVKGLDKTADYPSPSVFSELANHGEQVIRNFWRLLMLQYLKNELVTDWDEFLSTAVSSRELDLDGQITAYNIQLKHENRFVTIVYDYLDSQIREQGGLRGRVLSALLEVWRDIYNRYDQIRSKIFMRQDIFEREIDLTDKVKFNNHLSEINWDYDQLLNVVWKRLLHSERDLPEWFKNVILEHTVNQENTILSYVPILSESENRELLTRLIGKYMGLSNKAYPYNWIIYHVSDTHRRIQPRSLLNLFSEAARLQIEKDDFDYALTLRPRYMELAISRVAERRVQDVREEYPELKPVFDRLKDYHQQFPIDEGQLDSAIEQVIESTQTDREPLIMSVSQIKRRLENIGVLYEYKLVKGQERRYHIPDLYLFGMGLRRKGPGAHKSLFGKK